MAARVFKIILSFSLVVSFGCSIYMYRGIFRLTRQLGQYGGMSVQNNRKDSLKDTVVDTNQVTCSLSMIFTIF